MAFSYQRVSHFCALCPARALAGLSIFADIFVCFSPVLRTNHGAVYREVSNDGCVGRVWHWYLLRAQPKHRELQRELLLLPIVSTRLCHTGHPITLLLFVLYCPDAFWMVLLTKILYLCLLFSLSHGPNPCVPKAACSKSALSPVLPQQTARAACLQSSECPTKCKWIKTVLVDFDDLLWLLHRVLHFPTYCISLLSLSFRDLSCFD